MSAGKFRKKPVVIEAMRLSFDVLTEVEAWVTAPKVVRITNNETVEIDIQTLEGAMVARGGDWIIKGVQGEFYPCKPDIFEQTYEEVEQ